MSKNDNSSMYSGEPCDKCGGPTLLIGAGSIWCPSESCVPGGHFVRRVAFAQPPRRDSDGNWERGALPKRPAFRAPATRIASQPTSKPVKVKKADDGWGKDVHDFVETK